MRANQAAAFMAGFAITLVCILVTFYWSLNSHLTLPYSATASSTPVQLSTLDNSMSPRGSISSPLSALQQSFQRRTIRLNENEPASVRHGQVHASLFPEKKPSNKVDTHPSPVSTPPIHSSNSSSALVTVGAPPFVRQYSPSLVSRIPPSRSIPHVFLTVVPDAGAGIGHQFGEWGHGPLLAIKNDINYIYAPFKGNGQRWENFLGYSQGEDSEQDLYSHYDKVHVVEYDILTFFKEYPPTGHQSHANQPYIGDWLRNKLSEWRTKAPHLFEVNSTNPSTGDREALFFRLDKFHVGYSNMLCEPRLNLSIRKKHCMRSVRNPTDLPDSREIRYNYRRLDHNLQPKPTPPGDTANLPAFWSQPISETINYSWSKDESRSKYVYVAIHMRCGDSCFSADRSTPPEIIRNSVKLIVDTLAPTVQAENKQLFFHFFSQPPQNGTKAEVHFRPLLEWLQENNHPYATHFYLSSAATLHKLITSDIILGGLSSFSFLSAYLHNAVYIGVARGCSHFVNLKVPTGEFDTKQLLTYYKESKGRAPQFKNMQECTDMSEIEWNEAQALAQLHQ